MEDGNLCDIRLSETTVVEIYMSVSFVKKYSEVVSL